MKLTSEPVFIIDHETFETLVLSHLGQSYNYLAETENWENAQIFRIKTKSFSSDEQTNIDDFIKTGTSDGFGRFGIVPSLLKKMVELKVIDLGTYIITHEDYK